ncbi:DNA-binding protein [Cellulomonas sp. Root930]|nr:DNA-binding protein [Cellulomonas sp. Root930]
MTKRAVAEVLDVSPTAVSQWESGVTTPRADHMGRLAQSLDVPVSFLAAGRPYARLEADAAHFRSLRSTPARERDKAIAFTEQVWELTFALEKRVQFPPVDLPGFKGGEVKHTDFPTEPRSAARALREHWGLGVGPIAQMVRVMEKHGIIVTLVPFAGRATATVDAFSTSRLPRPVVVLTPDRANDVYRHRFTAAHELGHLLLHSDDAPGDPVREKEADKFAAEFLTPLDSILPSLPPRMDLQALDGLGSEWGVSVESLVYRSREVGTISESTYRRAFQRINQLRQVGLFRPDPATAHAGEVPALLSRAFDVAAGDGLTISDLADELHCTARRVRTLLGYEDPRPVLQGL